MVINHAGFLLILPGPVQSQRYNHVDDDCVFSRQTRHNCNHLIHHEIPQLNHLGAPNELPRAEDGMRPYHAELGVILGPQRPILLL